MDLIAIVPAYNESRTIDSVVSATSEYVDTTVVIDDASSDDTADVAKEAGAVVIEHPVNTGVGGALRTGYRFALRQDYDVVIQLDGDGQHDPNYIPEFVKAISDVEIVIGSRLLNESIQEYSFVRRTGIQVFTSIVNYLGGVKITDVTSGYRAFRTDALRESVHHGNRHWAIEQTMMAANEEVVIKEIPVPMPPREHGRSQFNVGTLLFYPLRAIESIARIVLAREFP